MVRTTLALLALMITGCTALPTPVGPTDTLRLLTFNVRYDTAGDGADAWPNRRHLVLRVMQSSRADVIGLQETLHHQLEQIKRALPAFESIGVGRDDGETSGEYAAILYRRDRFKVLDSGTFWLSDAPDTPGSATWGNRTTRICTWACLRDRRTNTPLWIYNVHFDHESQNAREKSADMMASRIIHRAGEGQAILMGDFNAGESNRAITTLLGAGLLDTFRSFRPDAEAVGTFNGFRGTADGEKIDYVFVTHGLTTHHAEIIRMDEDGRYPSDHFPVSATVSVSRN